MKCKRCRREIAENSIYCNWCGHKQITDTKEIRVPTPRRKGDKWVSQIMLNGERVYVYADSEEEYYAKAMAVKTRQIELKKAAPRLSLGAAIDNYIKDNDQVLSPSTINGYKSYRRTRFQRYIGCNTSDINWQRMVNDEAKLVSPKSVHNAWRLVTASLRHSGAEVPVVNLPQKTRSERPWLDYQQIEVFLSAIRGKPYELGALLALNGLRRSEILHLSSDDIDTKRGIIHVHGSSVVGEGNKLIDKSTNKTTSSSRDVHLVIPRINDLVGCKDGKLITTNPTTLYSSINKLCKANGLPEVGVHGLRHSFASLAYHLQWSEATTMREGGWSDPAVVNRIYTHLSNADANKDITAMQEFFATHTGQ